MNPLRFALLMTLCLLTCSPLVAQSPTAQPSIDQYESIQAALNANPNKMIFVPAGDHEISDRILINTDFSGFFGPGKIIQTNPIASILQVHNAKQVQIQDITLTRPESNADTTTESFLALKCEDIILDNVRVVDNRTRSGAIALRECKNGRVSNCLVKNYMRISIDDRTSSSDWGYAFHCIDGSGIVVTQSTGTQLLNNRVIEEHLLPTPEIKDKYQLGQFIMKNKVKGTIINQQTWDAEYVNNWHQGSAIIVSSPNTSDLTQITGNQIENAAQGIDLHCDHVIVSHNIINNAFMGLKAMHGSKHVLILGNQFIKNDLWSIGLMPGASSHAASKSTDNQPDIPDNSDGGSIIANNIISEFGYGHAHWSWGNNGSPLRFDTGQKPDNPPLSEVIIQGNIVYNSGKDAAHASSSKPRYDYAVRVDPQATHIHFSGNIFHAGNDGISNISLSP